MSVYKDKDRGTYYFVVRVETADKKYKQIKRRGFKTSKEAKLAEAEFLVDWDKQLEDEEGFKRDKGSIFFQTVATDYLEWYKPRRKSSSYKKISSIVNIQLIPWFGSRKMKEITNRDIVTFQNYLLNKYSVAHTKRIHAVLSALFNFGIKMDYTDKNPAGEVGNVDLKENKRIEYWTLEEFKQFLSVIDNEFYHTLFMTLYYSGMRKGELLALTWNDIDFENNTINIDKTLYYYEVTEPKTTGSIRKITMPKHTIQKLKQLKESLEYYKPDYVVFGEFYDAISTTTLDRFFHKHIEKAGVKRIRIHDFRHSHASYLINKNAIPAVVANRLGHSNPSTTLDIYSHLYPSTEKEIVHLMEDDFKLADIVEFKAK